jgi:hypothetical protein
MPSPHPVEVMIFIAKFSNFPYLGSKKPLLLLFKKVKKKKESIIPARPYWGEGRRRGKKVNATTP